MRDRSLARQDRGRGGGGGARCASAIDDAGPRAAGSSCWARSPTRELVDHYARCRAVYFAPWNEDYGFVTLEAFRSGKAVVTAAGQRRAGGAGASTGATGWSAAPTPEAVADQLDRAGADRGLAERLGAGGAAADAARTPGTGRSRRSLTAAMTLESRSDGETLR